MWGQLEMLLPTAAMSPSPTPRNDLKHREIMRLYSPYRALEVVAAMPSWMPSLDPSHNSVPRPGSNQLKPQVMRGPSQSRTMQICCPPESVRRRSPFKVSVAVVASSTQLAAHCVLALHVWKAASQLELSTSPTRVQFRPPATPQEACWFKPLGEGVALLEAAATAKPNWVLKQAPATTALPQAMSR